MFTPAVLVTGGFDGEIYHPERNSSCKLRRLPDCRYEHTQDGDLMCGGRYRGKSCRRWNADTGAWDLVTESLTKERLGHISWTPADGSVTYLMGGFGSPRTSEAIDQDNGVTLPFPMKYRTL